MHKSKNVILSSKAFFIISVTGQHCYCPCKCKKNDYYGCTFILNSSKQFWTRDTSKPWASLGWSKRAFPLLRIGTKNQNFLENLTSAAQFQLIDIFLAMTVYYPVRQLTLHYAGHLREIFPGGTNRGIKSLDGARGKKQVWRPHVWTWGLSEANVLYWKKYMPHCWDLLALGAPRSHSAPRYCFGVGKIVTPCPLDTPLGAMIDCGPPSLGPRQNLYSLFV